MRHDKTYAPFCPSISTRPNASYDTIIKEALKSYPGAKGDELLALSFMAQHSAWRIENAIRHYTEYHNDEDEREYRSSWVTRYLEDMEN